MKKIAYSFCVIAGVALLLSACGGKQYARKQRHCPVPYRDGSGKMKQVPSGTFHMGQADEDMPSTQVTGYSHTYQVELKSEAEEKMPAIADSIYLPEDEFNTESYTRIVENKFLRSSENPVSTFSIDVDGASYSNTRRFLNNGELPPADAVRLEEFINYFSYDYPNPQGEHPFSINTETAACPWDTRHKLVHIGIQGQRYGFPQLPNTNLVFLIDVSGSMSDQNKLPLLKRSFSLMVNQLRSNDRVAMVVYAGAAGVVLPPTSGADKETILKALGKLEAGGSTAGGDGIELAYKLAKENFIPGGINRVILATDGDFNVGVSSDGELTRLIGEKRKDGIFLSILGFGMGNYKDSKMEAIADNGNGNYFYIDNLDEARKVLVTELDGTLFAIAKDVKLQIEFNPSKVKAYRLIGYENRLLDREDFNDDKKDAGELGAGHTVTALYEIIPAGSDEEIESSMDSLKYQKVEVSPVDGYSDELLTVKFRYKRPDADTSRLIVHSVKNIETVNPSDNFRFSAAAAGFGMVLRNSAYKGAADYKMVSELAQFARGEDSEGHRAEFIKLVKLAETISQEVSVKK